MRSSFYGRRVVVAGPRATASRWNAFRAILVCLLTLVGAGGPTPLNAQQRQPTLIFDETAQHSIYAPIRGGVGTARTIAAHGSSHPHSFSRGGVNAAPAEGRSTGALVAGGLAGGVAGVIAGRAAGAWLSNLNCDVGCDESAAYLGIFGAMVGESLLLPLGVHLTNRRLGSYYPAMMASVAVTGAAVGLVYAMSKISDRVSSAEGLVVVVPILQLVASIQIERQTAKQ